MLHTILVGFLPTYVFILIFGMLGANYWVCLISIPESHIWPVILVLCVTGATAFRGNVFDAWTMFGTGVLGYAMWLWGYLLVPMVLNPILAPVAEENLRRSLVPSDGSSTIFLTSPIALVIILLGLDATVPPAVRSIRMNA